MAGGISYKTRTEIISRWLNGEQRDKIATSLNLGAGTISGIVADWKDEIGIPNADALRAIFDWDETGWRHSDAMRFRF